MLQKIFHVLSSQLFNYLGSGQMKCDTETKSETLSLNSIKHPSYINIHIPVMVCMLFMLQSEKKKSTSPFDIVFIHIHIIILIYTTLSNKIFD